MVVPPLLGAGEMLPMPSGKMWPGLRPLQDGKPGLGRCTLGPRQTD